MTFGKSCLIDPGKVPRLNIIPSLCDFVMSRPHKSGIQMLVKGIESASGNCLDLGVVEEVGVARAIATVNGEVLRVSCSERAEDWCSSVKVSAVDRHVRLWTWNLLARHLRIHRTIIKAS